MARPHYKLARDRSRRSPTHRSSVPAICCGERGAHGAPRPRRPTRCRRDCPATASGRVSPLRYRDSIARADRCGAAQSASIPWLGRGYVSARPSVSPHRRLGRTQIEGQHEFISAYRRRGQKYAQGSAGSARRRCVWGSRARALLCDEGRLTHRDRSLGDQRRRGGRVAERMQSAGCLVCVWHPGGRLGTTSAEKRFIRARRALDDTGTRTACERVIGLVCLRPADMARP